MKVTAVSPRGTIIFDSHTGQIIENHIRPCKECPHEIGRFDIDEYKAQYNGHPIPQFIDLLDIGHWDISGQNYEQPSHEWRKQKEISLLKSGVNFEPIINTSDIPNIIVILNGGIVQSILSDKPINVKVIDYDVEGSDDENADNDTFREIPEKEDTTTTTTAYIYDGDVFELNPEYVHKILKAIQ
ncbi:MAG TPA: hypothetical protein DCL77_14275 [Prolixibacteraceae bacterium]|jgi:hypothetical protein|nr:hypothetical protein [Prolixibacteraceae bacterium]